MHVPLASPRQGTPGIPGEMRGLWHKYFPVQWGQCGEIKVHSPHPWGKCGDFVFAVFCETVETRDENVCHLANQGLQIEHEAARWWFHQDCNIICFAKYLLIHLSYCCLLPTWGCIARCSFHWVTLRCKLYPSPCCSSMPQILGTMWEIWWKIMPWAVGGAITLDVCKVPTFCLGSPPPLPWGSQWQDCALHVCYCKK